MEIQKIIKEKQGTIIDVRSPAEFSGGHADGSINIPLNEIEERLNEIKAMKTPLVLCCASGGRSGQAHSYLSRAGVDCHNAGSWITVKMHQS